MNDWVVETMTKRFLELGEFKGTTREPASIKWKHDKDGKKETIDVLRIVLFLFMRTNGIVLYPSIFV